MTKQALIKLAIENKCNPNRVVRFINERREAAGTNWQALKVRFDKTAEYNADTYTPPGYRKFTTGEYVSNAYRDKFGWKNTYYQAACMDVVLVPRYFQ